MPLTSISPPPTIIRLWTYYYYVVIKREIKRLRERERDDWQISNQYGDAIDLNCMLAHYSQQLLNLGNLFSYIKIEVQHGPPVSSYQIRAL
jgi:hypothetical protein